ncbi:hypothetical protein MKW94_009675 [Papaver nudicaule]|uniref:NAC domain-containing protein n=1 Tax=Papaver nudicaule TaxID=74823 RepID=A0AA41VGL0_PAPNU|nr:hypothetical protein [Papaver nudicaule]
MQDPGMIQYPDVPIGFKFKPTDKELVSLYLKEKIEHPDQFRVPCMPDTNIYDFHPENLLNTHGFTEGNKDAYFFSSREKKHGHGTRANRIVKDDSGFWCISQAKKPVLADDGSTIGHKSGLVFYNGKKKTKGTKTKWLMQEFEISEHEPKIQCSRMKSYDRVICHIYEHIKKKSTSN